jgi:hypothetical protein
MKDYLLLARSLTTEVVEAKKRGVWHTDDDLRPGVRRPPMPGGAATDPPLEVFVSTGEPVHAVAAAKVEADRQPRPTKVEAAPKQEPEPEPEPVVVAKKPKPPKPTTKPIE